MDFSLGGIPSVPDPNSHTVGFRLILVYGIEAETTTVPDYSFRSIQQIPIAEKKSTNLVESLGLSLNNIFSTVAEAAQISPDSSLTLTPSSLVPRLPSFGRRSRMQTSTTFDLDLGHRACPLDRTITNTGAPYSVSNLTAATSTSSGGNWLQVSPSGTVTNGATTGTTGSATITFDPSALPPTGTYTGTVTITGTDGN